MKVLRKAQQWRGIYLAWFSRDFYSQVVLFWRGLALSYLMALLIAGWALTSIKLHLEVTSYMDNFLMATLKKCPDAILKDGRIQMKEKSPFIVNNPKTVKPIFIFDSRLDAPLPDRSLEGVFFVGKKEVIQAGSKRKVFDLTGSWKTSFMPESVMLVLATIRNYTAIVFFFVFLVISSLTTTLQVLFYGLLGFALSGILRRPLTYSQTARVAAIALIPQILLDFAQRILSVGIPFWIPVSALLTTVYLIYGIKASSVRINRGLNISTIENT